MPKPQGEKPHYHDHRKRLRERFRRAGSKGLQDYELLELLLTYAIPRKDVKPVAKRLIERFGSLSEVLDASYDELISVDGLGPASATLLGLMRELCAVYLDEHTRRQEALSSPEAVLRFAKAKLAGRKNEAFMVIFLNTKNEVMGHEILQEGTVDRAIVYPRRVIESALAHHASGLILVHNHPSGHAEPSREDRRLTRDPAEAARLVEIRVLDHLIVTKRGHSSFAESGLL